MIKCQISLKNVIAWVLILKNTFDRYDGDGDIFSSIKLVKWCFGYIWIDTILWLKDTYGAEGAKNIVSTTLVFPLLVTHIMRRNGAARLWAPDLQLRIGNASCTPP